MYCAYWSNYTRTAAFYSVKATWIKIKLYRQGSFVIGGYAQPPANVSIWARCWSGRYRVQVFSEKLLKALSIELDKIAVKDCPFHNLPATGRGLDPGLTAAEMKQCVWVKQIVICEVKFTEWTRDDRLRHPVFIGLREDKSPTDVVR